MKLTHCFPIFIFRWVPMNDDDDIAQSQEEYIKYSERAVLKGGWFMSVLCFEWFGVTYFLYGFNTRFFHHEELYGPDKD